MKLQQLRYIWEIVQHDLNVSATADSLFTSQPGISKQVRLLEDELGIPIFARNGKHFTEITPAGQRIVAIAGEILAKARDIKHVAQDHKNSRMGSLGIATTHTQARYALPPTIAEFRKAYPAIKLHIHQGTPSQIHEMALKGTVDMTIATETIEEESDNLLMLPCYKWNRCVLVPCDHPLTQVAGAITLEQLADYPIITYTFGFTGRSQLDKAFEKKHIHPQIALTAVDADVIKTYVKLGLGIGIVAKMAYDPSVDTDLTALDVSHLFEPSITKVCLKRDMYIRGFMFDFIKLFAPHLTRSLIEEAVPLRDKKEIGSLFKQIELPEH
jgi:LysR family transcriptional regulator, cys regulon transcriptional activator